MRESVIEKHLVKRVKELGGEVRKVKWIGRNAAPDRVVMLPRTWCKRREFPYVEVGDFPPQTIWVECKATGELPEPHQLREHQRMRAMGQRVEVIDSIEGVERLLQ